MSTTSQVVFVLGAPGSGKGTQCERIADKFGWIHLSVGELLRHELNNCESEKANLLRELFKDGKMAPVELTCDLLGKEMTDAQIEGKNIKFLIDGFPPDMDNMNGWIKRMEDKFNLCFVLLLECSKMNCTKRILERSKTSGRFDDNLSKLEKRFKYFETETKPVIEHYVKLGKVRVVNADVEPDIVFQGICKVFDSV